MDQLLAQAPQFAEILWLNIILSGDNAVVIGLAAAGLAPHLRSRAVLFGIVAAAVLRIVFSVFGTYLLSLWWVDIVGGLALLYIAWSFWRELRHQADEGGSAQGEATDTTHAADTDPEHRGCRIVTVSHDTSTLGEQEGVRPRMIGAQISGRPPQQSCTRCSVMARKRSRSAR